MQTIDQEARRRLAQEMRALPRRVLYSTCLECGQPFDHVRKDAKYCGPICGQRARRREQKGA